MKRWFLALVCGVLAFSALGQEKIVIRIAGHSVDKPVKEALIRDVVAPKLPPNVEVVFEPVVDDYKQWLLTMLAAGTPPDIFYVDVYWAEEVVRTGRVRALDEFLAKSEILKKEDLIPVLVQAFTVDGKLYAISKDFNSLVVFFNKDMFDAKGVPYPTAEDDWETLWDKVRRVHNPPEWVGICLNPDFARFLPFAFAAGMPFLNPDGTAPFARPEAIRAAEWFSAPIREGFGATAADLGVGWPGAAFVEEKAAVVIEGGWLIPPIREGAPLMNFGTTFLPTIDGRRGNYLFTVGYGMPVEEILPSKRPDLVWKVIELLTSPEAQSYILSIGHAIPSRAALLSHPVLASPADPFQEAMRTVFVATGLPGTVPFSFAPVGSVYHIVVAEALTKMFTGELSPAAAMQEAAEKLNKELKR
ncbi:MAG: extracellular solute-binding protein [Candidatus Bipolaricaulaceae bacterium]